MKTSLPKNGFIVLLLDFLFVAIVVAILIKELLVNKSFMASIIDAIKGGF